MIEGIDLTKAGRDSTGEELPTTHNESGLNLKEIMATLNEKKRISINKALASLDPETKKQIAEIDQLEIDIENWWTRPEKSDDLVPGGEAGDLLDPETIEFTKNTPDANLQAYELKKSILEKKKNSLIKKALEMMEVGNNSLLDYFLAEANSEALNNGVRDRETKANLN